MPVQFSINLDINSEEFTNFIVSRDNQHPYPVNVPQGFTLISTRQVIQPVTGSDFVSFPPVTIGERRKYEVIQNSIFVAEFELIIPVLIFLDVSITAQLYISDEVIDQNIRDEIKSLFDHFPNGNQVDPNDYLIQNGGGRILSSWFYVVPLITLTRRGEQAKLSEVTAMENMFRSNNKIQLSPNLGGAKISLTDNFGVKVIELIRQPGTEFSPFPREYPYQPKPVDELRQQVGKTQEEQKNNIFDEIVAKYGPQAECNLIRNNNITKDIAVIFSYPEFKIKMKPFSFEFGCFTVILSLPVLLTRTSDLTLFSVIYHTDPDHLSDYIFDSIKSCAVSSAIIGAVLGIVTYNFAVALAVFKERFFSCMQGKFASSVSCLFPELALNGVVRNDWTEVIS